MKRFILYAVILFQIGLIVSLVRGMQLSLQSKARIADLTATKQKLEHEQQQLVEQQQNVQSPYYLEQVARDELHLARPGETVVIIPSDQQATFSASPAPQVILEKPNWLAWWDVLSGKIN